MIKEKEKILGLVEEEWRQKSRTRWLKSGDRNTRFFHRFANQRQLSNAIWDVKVDGDSSVFYDESIKKEVIKHFSGVYTKDKEPSLLHQLEVTINFPRFFTDEEALLMARVVTSDEVFNILKLCCSDKSPGPDG